jgi:hypothetical protein
VPERKEKVLNRLRSLRGGRLDDARFRHRMRGQGPYAAQIRDLFDLSVRRAGLGRDFPEMSAAAFRRPGDRQLEWFG